MEQELKTSYFTFGFDHLHRYNERILNCDVVVKITAADPRQVMLDRFGKQWAFEYDEEHIKETMHYYPGGIVEIN
jgi:hypothetical protein